MIYYNYPPYYRTPLRQSSNTQYPRPTYHQDFSKPSVLPSPLGYSEKNRAQNKKTKDKTTSNNNTLKSNTQSTSKESFRRIDKPCDEPLFEILGIKLYFDDILLLSLIFFLYTEWVQYQYLFIALFLLLLS